MLSSPELVRAALASRWRVAELGGTEEEEEEEEKESLFKANSVNEDCLAVYMIDTIENEGLLFRPSHTPPLPLSPSFVPLFSSPSPLLFLDRSPLRSRSASFEL